MDHSDLATQERRDLADFLDTLSDEEWAQPSLCPRWSVRDVAGHVPSYDELGCAVALTDGIIHHQDIRRALGRPRTVPPERRRP